MRESIEHINVVCWRQDSPFVIDLADHQCEIRYNVGYPPQRFRTWCQQCGEGDYTLMVLRDVPVEMGYHAIRRMVKIAEDTGAVMLYSDRFTRQPDGVLVKNPVIDCQQGSLRDDFDFGSVVMFKTSALQAAVRETHDDWMNKAFSHDVSPLLYAGFYAVRLALMRLGEIVHIPEYLYTDEPFDSRPSGERIFDYLATDAAQKQAEMEAVCTWHLKKVGAYLPPQQYSDVDFSDGDFDVECSVVIPVLNRVGVIRDAIDSVLKQEAQFKFNLFVVDNHSTDGTTEAIDEYAHDSRLIHIIPGRNDLGIGGCWNCAAYDPRCGRFVVGLDSDDLFAHPHVLKTMVAKFYETRAAMVVGTYQVVNDRLQEVAPGVIAHKEWTQDNGRNNLLRVNGIGGPRAFFTPIYRRTCLPGSSYGEDYAMGLMISRRYRVGRVWDVMTLARRGDDNTDSNLSIEKENANNVYKDRLRTWELQARVALMNSNNENII